MPAGGARAASEWPQDRPEVTPVRYVTAVVRCNVTEYPADETSVWS
jgi:hypothetical protein